MSLDAAIAAMHSLESFDAEVARVAAPMLEAHVRSEVSAGRDPTGKAWPAKKDGTRPLVNAAKAVHAEASGNLVTLVVDGVEYFHQTAKEDGASPPRRRMIPGPGDAIPRGYQDVLDEAREEVGRRLMGGQ